MWYNFPRTKSRKCKNIIYKSEGVVDTEMTYRQDADKATMIGMKNIGVIRRSPDGSTTTLLHDISLSALRGEITGIVGPSGSGKSTLLRLVNRLEEPSSGQIFLDGEDSMRLDPMAVRRRVAMVLQKPFMFEGTVLLNLQQPFLYQNKPLPQRGSKEIVRSMELARIPGKLLERDARSLSGGEQQRVSLARALITAPQALLLDEPTSALDRPTTDQLALTLHDICHEEQLAILLVTHDLRLAERAVDHLIYLERGRILEEGAGEEILTRPHSDALRHFLAGPDKGKE